MQYMQQSLAKPVRTGAAPKMSGLPEAHATPGFASLSGLILYAAADPLDIRTSAGGWQSASRFARMTMPARLMRAIREYF